MRDTFAFFKSFEHQSRSSSQMINTKELFFFILLRFFFFKYTQKKREVGSDPLTRKAELLDGIRIA
jgi:hypothetical protein